jgi:hypothetical protein
MSLAATSRRPWTSEAPPAEAGALRKLLETLSLGELRLSEAELDRLVTAVADRPELWEDLVVDDADERWWLVLYRTDNFDLRLMAWETEQETRWHDHGGSSGAQAVCAGSLREDYLGADHLNIETRIEGAGAHGSFGPDHVHDVSHAAGHPAVSIHAYSPPLTVLTYYEQTPFGFVAKEILPDDRRVARPPAGAADASDAADAPRGAGEAGDGRTGEGRPFPRLESEDIL